MRESKPPGKDSESKVGTKSAMWNHDVATWNDLGTWNNVPMWNDAATWNDVVISVFIHSVAGTSIRGGVLD